MAAPASSTAAVMPLVFEGDGMWQMKQDLADKTKAALRALKVYNRVMIAPMTVNAEARANAQKAVIDTQRALTESRTYWVIAGLTERELWNKTEGTKHHLAVKQLWEEWRPSPTFWQVLQEGQKLLPEHKSDEELYQNAVRECAHSFIHTHNKGPGLCNSKLPLVEGLPLGKFLITHECTDKEYVKAMHLELVPRTNIDLYVNDEGGIKGIISALTARYNKHIAKMEELQKKSLALKEGKVGATAEKIIEENPAGRSLRQVAAIFESVSKRVDESKINRNWDDKDKPFKNLKLPQMGARPTNLQNLEKSKLHLVEDRGLEYVDAEEGGWYKFKLVSSCLKRSPPSVPFTENEGTINFFNKVLSPRLSRIIKITIQTKDGSAYEITIQPFHGMNTSVVCPFLARSEDDTDDMSNFTEREYNKVYQVQPYAIQGKPGFLETIGQLLRLTQIPEVFERLDTVSQKAENCLITGEKLFPASRVFYSASSRVAGAGSVLFICFSGQILGLLTFSPSIKHLWTDNVNPVKPPPFVAFRGRPRVGKKAGKFTASIFSNKAIQEDASKQTKIPNHITISNLPNGINMQKVDFHMKHVEGLIFESAPDVSPKLLLQPNIFKHPNGQILVNWELGVQIIAQASLEIIGYKAHQQTDPGNVLIHGPESEWKFKKDIKGAPRTAAEKIKIVVQITEGSGYTNAPSEIKLSVDKNAGPSVISDPTVAPKQKAFYYTPGYFSRKSIRPGSTPKAIMVGGIPTVIMGDDVAELKFHIFNSGKFCYNIGEDVHTGMPAVKLMPVETVDKKVTWGLFISDKNRRDYTMALKLDTPDQHSNQLFQNEPQMWEFLHDIHGRKFLTTVKREITVNIDERSGFYTNEQMSMPMDELQRAPPNNPSPDSPSFAPQGGGNMSPMHAPTSPRYPPPSDGYASRTRSPSQDGRSSRASGRSTPPSNGVPEDHTVSVVVPSSQATAAAGFPAAGGLYLDEWRRINHLEPGSIPKKISVNFLPGLPRIKQLQVFCISDSEKLIYKTTNPEGSKNFSMHIQKRTIEGNASGIFWEIYLIDGTQEIFMGRKVNKVSNWSGILFDVQPQQWLFELDINGSRLTRSADVDRLLTINNIRDAGFIRGSTNLPTGGIYAKASVSPSSQNKIAQCALLPLQPRRLSSRPAPAPWASPAVDMESLMASIDDIKRALNEVHLSARPRA